METRMSAEELELYMTTQMLVTRLENQRDRRLAEEAHERLKRARTTTTTTTKKA